MNTLSMTLLFAVLAGPNQIGPDRRKALPNEAAFVSSCVSFVNPYSGGIEDSNESVQHGFTRFKKERWHIGVEPTTTGFVLGYSRIDPLDSQIFSFRVEFQTVDNKSKVETCGPNRLFISRLLVRRGGDSETFVGAQALLALQQIN